MVHYLFIFFIELQNTLYERMYGKSLACGTDHDLSSANLLIESPEILRVREELENKEAKTNNSSQPLDIKPKYFISCTLNSLD